MPDLMTIVSYGFGTLFGIFLAGFLLYWLVHDLVQEKHSILRNYPLIGHLRYFLERQGEYFRQYFFAGDRDEMPFNRATRTWVYKNAKNEVGVVGFGSTNDLREPGSIIFVNAPFPVLEDDLIPTPSFMIGEGYCKQPFNARSVVNISGMSYGALSAPAVRALSRGAAEVDAGWLQGRVDSRPSIWRVIATSLCRLVQPSMVFEIMMETSHLNARESSPRSLRHLK